MATIRTTLLVTLCLAVGPGACGDQLNVASALVTSFPTATVSSVSDIGLSFEYFTDTAHNSVELELSPQKFSQIVESFSGSYGLTDGVKNSILDGLYGQVNQVRFQQLDFIRGGPGHAAYGCVATMKREDGTIDLAVAASQANFKLNPEIIHHKKVKRFLGIKTGTKRWVETKERTLSEKDRGRITDYMMKKALDGFSAKFRNQITGTCASSGC